MKTSSPLLTSPLSCLYQEQEAEKIDTRSTIWMLKAALLDVNLAYGFSAGGLLNRDLETERNVYSSYWLGYQSQCWGVKLSLEKQPGITRFLISFDLLGLIEDVGGKVWGLE
jgi:hypothetical protein